jgi:hypothetical protein
VTLLVTALEKSVILSRLSTNLVIFPQIIEKYFLKANAMLFYVTIEFAIISGIPKLCQFL